MLALILVGLLSGLAQAEVYPDDMAIGDVPKGAVIEWVRGDLFYHEGSAVYTGPGLSSRGRTRLQATFPIMNTQDFPYRMQKGAELTISEKLLGDRTATWHLTGTEGVFPMLVIVCKEGPCPTGSASYASRPSTAPASST